MSLLRGVAALHLLGVLSCRVPSSVHRPLEYPPPSVEAAGIVVHAQDHRLHNPRASVVLGMPAGLEEEAQSRVERLALGQGPTLQVLATIEQVHSEDLVDSRGEMTRLSVDLRVAVRTDDGRGLLSGNAHSHVDIPREEATEQQLQQLLQPTALNAFDRFWVAEGTIERINRAVRRAARQGSAPPE